MLTSIPRSVLRIGVALALLGTADAQSGSDEDVPPVRLVVMFKDSRTGRPSYGTFNIEDHSMLYMTDSTGIVRVRWVQPGKWKLFARGPDGRSKKLSIVVTGVTPDTVVVRVGQKSARSKR